VQETLALSDVKSNLVRWCGLGGPRALNTEAETSTLAPPARKRFARRASTERV